jgi:hypothetical protein
MLSPNDKPIALLPQDRQLIKILGITEIEYRQFIRQCAKKSEIKPGEPTCVLTGFEIVLINFVIGLIITATSALLFRPKPPSVSGSADIRQNSVPGQN